MVDHAAGDRVAVLNGELVAVHHADPNASCAAVDRDPERVSDDPDRRGDNGATGVAERDATERVGCYGKLSVGCLSASWLST